MRGIFSQTGMSREIVCGFRHHNLVKPTRAGKLIHYKCLCPHPYHVSSAFRPLHSLPKDWF